MSYQSINPYSGEVIKNFDTLSNEQLSAAITTAQSCFEKWRHSSFAERAAVVGRAALLMSQRTEEFARQVTLEMGRLIAASRGADFPKA